MQQHGLLRAAANDFAVSPARSVTGLRTRTPRYTFDIPIVASIETRRVLHKS